MSPFIIIDNVSIHDISIPNVSIYEISIPNVSIPIVSIHNISIPNVFIPYVSIPLYLSLFVSILSKYRYSMIIGFHMILLLYPKFFVIPLLLLFLLPMVKMEKRVVSQKCNQIYITIILTIITNFLPLTATMIVRISYLLYRFLSTRIHSYLFVSILSIRSVASNSNYSCLFYLILSYFHLLLSSIPIPPIPNHCIHIYHKSLPFYFIYFIHFLYSSFSF